MILVFGKTGQVARELAGLMPDAVFLDRAAADLGNPDACAALIHKHAPSAVINAAAYTAVDKAEDDEALATRINGDAPGAMAIACAALDIPFVHISTDYVFPGGGTSPWAPGDTTAPLNAYGRSKLRGEDAVRGAGGAYAILRTSWVISAHGANFVKSMLRLGEVRDQLNIVADQIGGPTCARDIARACLRMVQTLTDTPDAAGTYHLAGGPDVSWADFAREIFAQSGLACAVADIPSTDYPTPAQRPLNSRMDMTQTTATFGIERPDWRAGLTDILADLGALEP